MDEMEVYMKKSRVTCKRFRNMQCYTDTEHLDCAKCEKFEPLDNIADDSEKVSYNVNSPAHYDEIKLKHCPFCGRKPKITDLGQVKILSCEFSGCGIHPRICYTWRPGEEKEAIKIWNKRSTHTDTKNGAEDLKKARWYLDRAINEFENEDS